jgi:two-component system, cell cycle sensor histidine kinase and response regulator CckA
MSNSLVRFVQTAVAVGAPTTALAWSLIGAADARPIAAVGLASVALAIASRGRASPRRASAGATELRGDPSSEEDIMHTDQLESLGVLAGGIAHDFNNLLTGILGNTALALNDLPAGQARDCVQEADTAARRARALVAQILAYSGRGELELRPVDLPQVVRETRTLLTRVISPKAELEIHGRPEQVIEGDPAQIRQVVMNLLTNASDALEDKPGRISVRIAPQRLSRRELDQTVLGRDLPPGRYLRLEVRDTGCGMSEGTVHRMFEPYFTTKPTGRGLGLAALLGIVRHHRGTLRVESVLGQGTTVIVWFPAPAAGLLVIPSDPGLNVLQKQEARTGRVLLAEDEEMVRRVAARMLSRLGYQVVAVSDGREALAELERGEDYAFAVIDVQMPGVDGREVLRRLRHDRSDLPTVLMTGYAGEDSPGETQPDAWLRKPFSLKELMAALDAAQVSVRGTPPLRMRNTAP